MSESVDGSNPASFFFDFSSDGLCLPPPCPQTLILEKYVVKTWDAGFPAIDRPGVIGRYMSILKFGGGGVKRECALTHAGFVPSTVLQPPKKYKKKSKRVCPQDHKPVTVKRQTCSTQVPHARRMEIRVLPVCARLLCWGMRARRARPPESSLRTDPPFAKSDGQRHPSSSQSFQSWTNWTVQLA